MGGECRVWRLMGGEGRMRRWGEWRVGWEGGDWRV